LRGTPGVWPDEQVKMLCEELDLIHCVDPFRNESLSAGTDYFRLHGITSYVYTYTNKELEILRNKIRQKSTYVMFNNTTMKEDALRFMKVLNASTR